MANDRIHSWEFINQDGDFTLNNPHQTSYLYFPLVNEAGMMSVVTPNLHGDVKINQHAFLLPPVSVEDLHTSRLNRNFWLFIEGVGPWSATGNSAQQIQLSEDQVTLTAGFLWQQVNRENHKVGIRVEVTSFVPSTSDPVELMRVSIINTSTRPMTLAPTAAIPIFGRSADNLRDHRNVTSLLHRIRCENYGVLVQPTLSFDERGHQLNNLKYAVLGADGNGVAPTAFFPVMEDFIGEGGTFDWPKAVTAGQVSPVPPGTRVDGYEALGGLCFPQIILQPGEIQSYIILLAILSESESTDQLLETYLSDSQFFSLLKQTKSYWQSRLGLLTFKTGDPLFNKWVKWVTLQPILRRLYGCSFLPYHDYGRGGRGWRDLWQDILALLFLEKGPVDHLLFGNFAGVRLDGSNATIIGTKPGEFKADRNNIPRVWMDHGAWPLLTTKLYIDQTGDLEFLLRQQVYFKDNHVNRCKVEDINWDLPQGTIQRSVDGKIYYGSIFEHLLVENLSTFFNVGDHNNILLEGADWNDGMDMARNKGESVAFTAFYANNLHCLSQFALNLRAAGVNEIEIANEMIPLLDTLNQPVNYASPVAKRERLFEYFTRIRHAISGQKTRLDISQLFADLNSKAEWLIDHLRNNEWVQNIEGYSWFNGYYDDEGDQLEGDHPMGVRMTLTGQVFPLMGYISTGEQARQQVRSINRYLYAPELQGFRLNTDFKELKLNMGRCFGYAYGHKENGAMFSHMAVMYAYALYERGFVHEGYHVMNGIYKQSVDFKTSRMYPGIPEYLNNNGRGMYPYLTGSASWYLLTLITRIFGVYGILGDLAVNPKLVNGQFDPEGNAGLNLVFSGRIFECIFQNPDRLEYGEYQVGDITLDDMPVERLERDGIIILSSSIIRALDDKVPHRFMIKLASSSRES